MMHAYLDLGCYRVEAKSLYYGAGGEDLKFINGDTFFPFSEQGLRPIPLFHVEFQYRGQTLSGTLQSANFF